MATGITQPGGVGTTIMFEDDTASPGGSYYTEADFAAAFPADFVDLGTTPKSYLAKVSVQNGDAAGTATTTWKGTRSGLRFNTGFTYIVSATGLANRWTKWGTLTTGATGEPVGYDGLSVHFGTNPTIRGNFELYGCDLRNEHATASLARIFLNPGLTTSTTDIVDVSVFTLGTQSYGGSTDPINRIRRLKCYGTGATLNGRLVGFNCNDADDVVFSFPNGNFKIQTGQFVTIARPVFIGPSVIADTTSTFAMQFLDPTWSRNVIKVSQNFHEEWLPFGMLVHDSAGLPVSGARVEMWDPFDKRLVVDTLTDATGRIAFTSPASIAEIAHKSTAPFPNALLVNGHANDGVFHRHDPFTLWVNRSGILSNYRPHTQLVTFPYETFLTTELQFFPLFLDVELSASANNGIPIEANGVERVYVTVPESL